MTSKNEIKGLLGQVKQAALALKDQISLLDDKIDTLHARRSFILSAPLSKDDYMRAIRTSIKAKAGFFEKSLRNALTKEFKVTYPVMQVADRHPINIPFLDAGLTGRPYELSDRGFYYYYEDAIMSGVERALVDEQWPVDAMPADDRKTELAAIDAQIEKLTLERDSLADDLVSCGVTE